MLEHLPALLVLTDRRMAGARGHTLAEVVGSLGGLDVAVVLREKDLDPPDRAETGREVADAADRGGIPLLVASDPDLAEALGADGLHLAGDDPAPSWIASGGPGHPGHTGHAGSARHARHAGRPDRPVTVGRSCHCDVDLDRAASEALDYVTLSPVFETASKPGYGPPLGLEGLARFILAAELPVYGLGGVAPGRAAACILAGAHGVAVMGAVMAAPEPRAVAEALVGEVHRAWVERNVEARS